MDCKVVVVQEIKKGSLGAHGEKLHSDLKPAVKLMFMCSMNYKTGSVDSYH